MTNSRFGKTPKTEEENEALQRAERWVGRCEALFQTEVGKLHVTGMDATDVAEVSERLAAKLSSPVNHHEEIPTLADYMRLWFTLEELKRMEAPCTAIWDGLQILNPAAIEARQHAKDLDEEELERLKQLKLTEHMSKLGLRFWSALELKPGAFGFAIDVKKFLKLEDDQSI